VTTVATVEAYTYPLSCLPFNDVLANGIDDACDFVTRNYRVLNVWK
jgi:hypothetical protein